MSIWQALETISDVMDIAMHPRFYLPLLGGIAIAFALSHWMPADDLRDVLQATAVMTGLAIGVIWGWSK